MRVTICTKCGGPVSVENAHYVCALCGAIYGEADAAGYDGSFFDTASLEKLRRISRLLNEKVPLNWAYVVAPLSNGQFFVRHTPQPGYDSVYRGQCATENWYSVKSIYAAQEYTVAIGVDGQLQPSLVEVENLFAHMERSGISHMRMKQILRLRYGHSYTYNGKYTSCDDCFLGLDTDGKVVIYNPFGVFDLNKERSEHHQLCLTLTKNIRSWPPVERLEYLSDILIGITADGRVFAEPAGPYSTEKDRQIATALSAWTDMESIVYNLDTKVYIGLKKDGTLISSYSEEYTKSLFRKDLSANRDIVQIDYSYATGLSVLTRQGVLYCSGNKKAEQVIAILRNGCGYVCADGSVYEYVERKGFMPINNLKLFSSVETMEEAYRHSEKGALEKKTALEAQKQDIMQTLQTVRVKLSVLQQQYSDLGLFKMKEKKALRPSMDALSKEVSSLESRLEAVKNALSALPSGKAAWRHFDLPKPGTYSASQISAAAYQAVAYNKPNASVVGSAVVGGVIAGPVGAIVGAIYAADKNRKNEK